MRVGARRDVQGPSQRRERSARVKPVLSHSARVEQVRHVAVSNETPYGVTKFIEHHVWDDLPKIVSVQSPYNLLTQTRVELGEESTPRC